MRKTLAVVRREYTQGIRSKAFIISTLLAPLFMLFMFVLPGLLFTMKTGGATRLAVVDQTGRMYEPVREALLRADDDKRRARGCPRAGRDTRPARRAARAR